jgi:hypothetical protein
MPGERELDIRSQASGAPEEHRTGLGQNIEVVNINSIAPSSLILVNHLLGPLSLKHPLEV